MFNHPLARRPPSPRRRDGATVGRIGREK